MFNPNGASWPARAIAHAGLLFVFLVAVLAAVCIQDSLYVVAHAYGDSPLPVWAWRAALPVAAIAGLLLWKRLDATFWRARWVLPVGLALTVAFRALIAWRWDAPLISDFLEYHQLALQVLAGGSWFSELRPMGFPIVLAGAYRLLGDHGWVGEAVNVGGALLTAGLLYGLVRRSWGPAAAGWTLLLYALCPGQALMVLPLGTEIAYGAAFIAAVWAAIEAREGRWGLALVAGALLGLSQYVRPTSLAMLPAFLLLPFLLAQPWQRAAKVALATAAAFFLVLTPVAVHNHQAGSGLSFSTSNWGGWSLLVGANQKHNGAWNVDDVALMAPHKDLREMDKAARAEAMRRIQGDPVGYAALLVRKFPLMWASEHYAAYWSMGTQAPVDERKMGLWMLLSQVAFALVTTLAALALMLDRRAPAPATLLMMAIALTVAALHALMEVQSRYHFYVTPVFLILAGVALARLQEESRPAIQAAPEASKVPVGSR